MSLPLIILCVVLGIMVLILLGSIRQVDEYERGIIINALNDKRNTLLKDGRYTDAVDEVLLKVINAKQKRFKIRYTED